MAMIGNFGGMGGGNPMQMIETLVCDLMQEIEGGQGQGQGPGGYGGGDWHRGGRDGCNFSDEAHDHEGQQPGQYGQGNPENPLQNLMQSLGLNNPEGCENQNQAQGCQDPGESNGCKASNSCKTSNGCNCTPNPCQNQGPQPEQIKQGQTFKTPSGATINWNGDKISVSEPGTGNDGKPDDGSFAESGSNPNGSSWSVAASWNNPAGQGQAARNWNVWGDPHISNPNGSSANFSTNGGLFQLEDGSHLYIGAPASNQQANTVTWYPVGANLSGLNQSQTTDYVDNSATGGAFQNEGTLSSLNSQQFV